jgi:hypothetical protein
VSDLLDSYRRNAEAARIAAEQASLPNARMRAKTDQETWTKFADRLEWLEKRQREKREKSADSTLTGPAQDPERS